MRQSRLLDLRQDEFIAMAGHELKTPLTAIKGFMELLSQRKKYIKEKKAEEYLEAMGVQVDRMTQLVRDLMDTSKIRTGKLVLSKKKLDLDNLLAEVIKTIQPAAEGHLISKNTRTPVVVEADRDRITQVLTNLLSNAVKYSPTGTKVIVSARKEDDQVVVSVADFGVGIKKEDVERIFDPFYQGKRPMWPGRGLGLGLFISSQIIKMHGGKIWVESIWRKGSTFFFTLPT